MKRILFIGSVSALLVAQLTGCAILQSDRPGDAAVSEKDVVVVMLDTAQIEAETGQPERAAALLERALRIEPRNAVIWHRLARLHLEQGAFRQATNLAAKSNTLAGSNDRLRAANWQLIGQARQRIGDTTGAQAAFGRAARFAGNNSE